jgi:hypothetical protein
VPDLEHRDRRGASPPCSGRNGFRTRSSSGRDVTGRRPCGFFRLCPGGSVHLGEQMGEVTSIMSASSRTSITAQALIAAPTPRTERTWSAGSSPTSLAPYACREFVTRDTTPPPQGCLARRTAGPRRRPAPRGGPLTVQGHPRAIFKRAISNAATWSSPRRRRVECVSWTHGRQLSLLAAALCAHLTGSHARGTTQ